MSTLSIALIVYAHFAGIFICAGLIVHNKLDVRKMGLWPKEDFWMPPAVLALIPVLNLVLIGVWINQYFFEGTEPEVEVEGLAETKTLALCILVTEDMEPIPRHIQVIQDFGSEGIWSHEGNLVQGTAYLVRGYPEDIKDWLRPFGLIWTSLSPLTGKWEGLRVT